MDKDGVEERIDGKERCIQKLNRVIGNLIAQKLPGLHGAPTPHSDTLPGGGEG